jgi:outer membrane protein TolC
MRGLGLVVVLVAPAFGNMAGAQESVTESQFVEGVGADHAAARALGEELARAEALRRRAAAFANPRLEFSREQPDDSPRQDTWSLAWVPPVDGRRGLARGAAEAGVEAARERVALERARLRREVRRAYADWSLTGERRAFLSGQLALVEDLAGKAQQRARVGEESGLAARRLELAASEVQAQFVVARTQQIRAEATALGWRPDLAGRRPTMPVLPPPPSIIDPASRPDLRALQHEARQAALEARLTRRFWTAPELQAGWQRLADRGSSVSGPVFGLAWTVPLFDRNQAGRIEAASREQIAQARLALASGRAERELKAAQEAYAVAAAAAEESVRGSADADRLIAAASASFRAGEATLTDLLDTLRSVREARLRSLDLLGAALEAHRELELWGSGLLTSGEGR